MSPFGKKHKKQNEDDHNITEDIAYKIARQSLLHLLATPLPLDLGEDQKEQLIEQAIKQAYKHFSK